MPRRGVAHANDVWPSLATTINRGLGTTIIVPDAHKPILGRQGMRAIATHYSRMIGVPAVINNDVAARVISIQPRQDTWDPAIVADAAVVANAPEESKKGKLPRPPNAFILYRQHHHPIVKESHPGLHNNQISIILGKQWNSEGDAVKDMYKRLADQIKTKHMKDHPDYQYQPRKSAERKRRMTRRRAEALSKLEDSQEGASTNSTSALPVPHVLQKTPAGNSVITIGEEDMDDETFVNMLKEHNDSVTAAYPQAEVNNQVLYTERTAETQADLTMSQSDMDALLRVAQQVDRDLEAEMARILGPVDKMDTEWKKLSRDDQTYQWDFIHHHDPKTELGRVDSFLGDIPKN